MPKLLIDGTTIDWRRRESARAKRLRIVVSPDGVEVVVPQGRWRPSEKEIEDFVASKARWIRRHVTRIENQTGTGLEQRYEDGATLLLRGRRLPLEIRPAAVAAVEVDFEQCDRIPVRTPQGMAGEIRSAAVRAAVVRGLGELTLAEARDWVRTYENALGVRAADLRVTKAKTRWGSCGRRGVIRVHWRLSQAPPAVAEYVVAHEMCHLLEANHGPRFWAHMGRVMPDWRARRTALRRWEREQLIEGRDL